MPWSHTASRFGGAECESYTDVYRTYGLLHERAYFAHCCHCGTDEQQLLKLHDTGYVSYPSIKTCPMPRGLHIARGH